MIEQLINMGYAPKMVKKALIECKNESIPVALDAIEKIQEEETKKAAKKKIKKKDWECPSCTFINKGTSTSC